MPKSNIELNKVFSTLSRVDRSIRDILYQTKSQPGVIRILILNSIQFLIS
jgi:hypothetical protein